MPKFRFHRSLKLRLFVLIILSGLIPAIIISYSVLEGYESRAIKVKTQDAQTQLNILADHLITYNYLNDTSSDVINAELRLLSNLSNGRVMVMNNALKIIKDTYGMSEGKTMVSGEVVKCLSGHGYSNYDEVNGYIEIAIPIMESHTYAPSDGNEGVEEKICKGVLLTSVSTDTTTATIEILRARINTVFIIIVLVLFVFALAVSLRTVRPFDRLSDSINEVKTGMSYTNLYSGKYLETEHIVSAFNDLLERMRVLDETRQEFVANVSHELKTPLTSVKILADSLNSEQNVPPELYKEFMADIATEIEREDKIINDLLALVKLSGDAAKLNITPVNITELTEIVLKRLRPIARKENIELILESNREVIAEIDEVKMTLALTNLVENAIKYNRPEGKVTVTIDADHQFFTVTVTDTGEGIPEEAIPQVFERFYRVDKSHSRKIGGTGLGLAITKSAVALHKGVVTCRSTLGEGSTFEVRIPIKSGIQTVQEGVV